MLWEELREEIKNKKDKWNSFELENKNMDDVRETVRNYLLDFFKEAKQEVFMCLGEMSSVMDEKFTEDVKKIMSSNTNLKISLIAGPIITALKKFNKELYNPFLKLKEYFPKRVQVYLNDIDIKKQNEQGYFHMIVIDDGVRIHFEQTHDYTFSHNFFAIGKEDFEIGFKLVQFFNEYINKNELMEIDDTDAFVFMEKKYFEETFKEATKKDEKFNLKNYIGEEKFNLLQEKVTNSNIS